MAPPARCRCSSRPGSPASPTSISRIRAMAPAESERRAGAVLEVDLGAIVANWRSLGGRHPSGPVAGVIKADAYGLGACPVAEALYAAGCRHFFVPYVKEALAVRDLLPGAMIAVLNGPIPGTEAAYPANDLTPVL